MKLQNCETVSSVLTSDVRISKFEAEACDSGIRVHMQETM